MGGCTNCKEKSGCDDRKGSMLGEVDAALGRLYPTRTWGERAAAGTAWDGLSGLADELASELSAATFVAQGLDDALCDHIYLLCMGRPPCAVQVRDHGVAAPAEWEAASIEELYLRVAISRVVPMAAVQELAIDVTASPGGYVIRERPRAGVYGAPLLRRMQRLVAILPAYDLLHVDFGEISAPPPGFAPGAWTEMYGGAPPVASYLFLDAPPTMEATSWLPREAGAHAC
jgi:hypothetical protein